MKKSKIALAITIPLSFTLITGCTGSTPVVDPTGIEQSSQNVAPIDSHSAFIITSEAYRGLALENVKDLSPDNSLTLDGRDKLTVNQYGTTSSPVGDKAPAEGEQFHAFSLNMSTYSDEGMSDPNPTIKIEVDGDAVKTLNELQFEKENAFVVSANDASSIILHVSSANEGELGSIDLKTGIVTEGKNAIGDKEFTINDPAPKRFTSYNISGTINMDVEDFAIMPEHNGKVAENNGQWVTFSVEEADIEIMNDDLSISEDFDKASPTFMLITKDETPFRGMNDDGYVSIEVNEDNVDFNGSRIVATIESKVKKMEEQAGNIKESIDIPIIVEKQ